MFYSGRPSRLAHPFVYVRALVLALLGGVIAGLITTIAAGHEQSGWVFVGVAGVFGLVALRAELRRARVRQLVTERRIRIETGLLTRRRRHGELDWVQAVRVHQSMLGRLLGVGTVVIVTDEEFRLHGVRNPRRLVRLVNGRSPSRQQIAPRERERVRI